MVPHQVFADLCCHFDLDLDLGISDPDLVLGTKIDLVVEVDLEVDPEVGIDLEVDIDLEVGPKVDTDLEVDNNLEGSTLVHDLQSLGHDLDYCYCTIEYVVAHTFGNHCPKIWDAGHGSSDQSLAIYSPFLDKNYSLGPFHCLACSESSGPVT